LRAQAADPGLHLLLQGVVPRRMHRKLAFGRGVRPLDRGVVGALTKGLRRYRARGEQCGEFLVKVAHATLQGRHIHVRALHRSIRRVCGFERVQRPAQLDGVHRAQPLAQLLSHIQPLRCGQRLRPGLQEADELGAVKSVGLVHRKGRVPAMGKTDYFRRNVQAPPIPPPEWLLQMFGEVAWHGSSYPSGRAIS
jgi:hypothetical protein